MYAFIGCIATQTVICGRAYCYRCRVACVLVCQSRLWAVLKWMNRSRCRVDRLWCPGPSLDTTYNSLAAVEPSTWLLCDSDNNVTYCNCTLRRTYKISSLLSYSSVNKSLQHWQQNVALLLPPVEQLWQVQIILYALRWVGRCRAPELSFPVEGSGPHAMQRLWSYDLMALYKSVYYYFYPR